MALLIRSEQQFTCLFKFILVCKATVTAPGEKSPPLVAKGNLSPSKRNKVCMSWNRSQMMERFFRFVRKPPVKCTGKTARAGILGGLTHPPCEIDFTTSFYFMEWYNIKSLDKLSRRELQKSRKVSHPHGCEKMVSANLWLTNACPHEHMV